MCAMALEVIQPQEVWNVIDPSKLDEYLTCPRKYFFAQILGWQSTYPNNHLVFGTAWHLAQEHLLRQGYSKEAVEEAQFIFFTRYRQDFSAETDDDFGGKTPANAIEALEKYVQTFAGDKLLEVKYTEVSGVTLVDEDKEFHFRIDAIMYDPVKKKYFFLDHKTSQRKTSDWGDAFVLSNQMLAYQHVLFCLYPKEEIGASRVRCAFFRKKSPSEFEEQPLTANPSQLQAWLHRVNAWMDRLEHDMEIFRNSSTDTHALNAFPQNTKGCFMYNQKCRFFNHCLSVPNPLTKANSPPTGFLQAYWDPREGEAIRTQMDLTQDEIQVKQVKED